MTKKHKGPALTEEEVRAEQIRKIEDKVRQKVLRPQTQRRWPSFLKK